MKRTVLLLIASIFSILAIAQEREVKIVELINGNTVSGYVQTQQDGSYLVETESGDVFFFSQSEVKSINATKKAFVSGDLDYYGGITVEKKKGKLYKLSSGKELIPADFMSYSDWEKYRKAQNIIKTANTLLIVSGSMVAVGGILAIIYFADQGDIDLEWMGTAGGCIGMFVAAPLAITSLVLGISGNKQLATIKDAYNYHPGYVVDFGMQQYGLGFALKF